MNFGQAIEALKEGKKVARDGWNGKGMFLTLNGGLSIESSSVNGSCNTNSDFLTSQGLNELKIGKHIDMWTAQKELCVGWLASQTDMLSEDWVIID